MDSNQPPIKHLNKESISQQHSIQNMESNLNKERERENEIDVAAVEWRRSRTTRRYH
jgi:hypothetical protein